jgi:hypothetical protein
VRGDGVNIKEKWLHYLQTEWIDEIGDLCYNGAQKELKLFKDGESTILSFKVSYTNSHGGYATWFVSVNQSYTLKISGVGTERAHTNHTISDYTISKMHEMGVSTFFIFNNQIFAIGSQSKRALEELSNLEVLNWNISQYYFEIRLKSNLRYQNYFYLDFDEEGTPIYRLYHLVPKNDGSGGYDYPVVKEIKSKEELYDFEREIRDRSSQVDETEKILLHTGVNLGEGASVNESGTLTFFGEGLALYISIDVHGYEVIVYDKRVFAETIDEAKMVAIDLMTKLYKARRLKHLFE